MRFDVVTIFPGLVADAASYGVLGRAIEQNLIQLAAHDLRDWCHDRYRQVDDTPYGGGPGMVMKPEPFFEAVEQLRGENSHVVLLSPQGRLLSHELARDLSERQHLILLCGRYEGVDERVRSALVDEEVSIGDYVLSGGELAALVVLDAVGRLVDGVLGNDTSTDQESHTQCLLEYPQYTRPAEYRSMAVPAELAEGHHEQIRLWRRRESLRRTLERRPDLLARAVLTDEDWQLLGEL